MSIDQSAPPTATAAANATQRFAIDKQVRADTAPKRVSLLAREVLKTIHGTTRCNEVTYDFAFDVVTEA